MYEAPKQGETRHPKHTHYVSLGNGFVYPAMRNLPGYEDDNPGSWRPATSTEVERYIAGQTRAIADPSGTLNLMPPAAIAATPTTLTLAPDDPPPAPDDTQDPPPLPASALGAIGPAPAFKID